MARKSILSLALSPCLSFFLIACSPLSAEVGFIPPWGKDQEISHPSEEIHDPYTLPPVRKSLPSYCAEKVIRLHQTMISPIQGSRSSFRPSSSRYMQIAVRRYGFIKGFMMGCDRLQRENGDPWVYRTVVIDDALYKWDPTY